ncbi:DUF6232 family protein [Streptomyces xanthophaeus]
MPPAPSRGRVLVLQVSRRMLWIGSAAFPLHNITRVEAFKVKPDLGATLLRLLKWLFVTAVVYAVVNYASRDDARVGEDGNPLFLVILVVLVVLCLKDLFQASKPVLAVETASGSEVVVTLPNMDELRQIAGLITHAIDNPAAEFSAYVNQINNTTNHYGPVVNMNNGQRNTGFRL